MAFERFIKTARVYSPFVTIWARGQLAFSAASVRKYHIETYQFAVLHFDLETRRIGIQLTNDAEEPGAIRLRKIGHSFALTIKAFYHHYNLPLTETRQYVPHLDDATQFLVLSLDNSSSKSRRPSS
jgi:hypothetical protein